MAKFQWHAKGAFSREFVPHESTNGRRVIFSNGGQLSAFTPIRKERLTDAATDEEPKHTNDRRTKILIDLGSCIDDGKKGTIAFRRKQENDRM